MNAFARLGPASVALLVAVSAVTAGPITTGSLVEEMIDMRQLTVFPSPAGLWCRSQVLCHSLGFALILIARLTDFQLGLHLHRAGMANTAKSTHARTGQPQRT